MAHVNPSLISEIEGLGVLMFSILPVVMLGYLSCLHGTCKFKFLISEIEGSAVPV